MLLCYEAKSLGRLNPESFIITTYDNYTKILILARVETSNIEDLTKVDCLAERVPQYIGKHRGFFLAFLNNIKMLMLIPIAERYYVHFLNYLLQPLL